MSDFYRRFIELKNEIKVVKGVFNKYGNFMYRTLEQIEEALKPLEKKYEILFFTNEELIIHDNNTKTCKAIVNVIDATSGEVKLTRSSFADYQADDKSTKMNASQLSGSASSYAVKYALSRALGLDDTRDSDDEELTPTQKVVKRAPNTNFKVEHNKATEDKLEVKVEEQLDKTKFLYELKQGSLKAKNEDDINNLLEQLDNAGGDDATKKVIEMKARQLGLSLNIRTKKYGKAAK